MIRIASQVRSRPYSKDDVVDGLNRELVPLVKRMRDAIVSAVRSQTVTTSGEELDALADANEAIVFVSTSDPSWGSGTLYLPAEHVQGDRITIVDDDGEADSSTITIDGNGAEINGSSTEVISSAFGYRTLVSSGTNWRIIGAA